MCGFLLGALCLIALVAVLKHHHGPWGGCSGHGSWGGRGWGRGPAPWDVRPEGGPCGGNGFFRAQVLRHVSQRVGATPGQEKVIAAAADEVMQADVIWPGVMTRLMACPPTCGSAAAVLVSEAFAKKHGLRTDVRILAQAMATDRESTFERRSMISLVGADMVRDAVSRVYERAGVGPDEIDVCELHDCFAQNELISYEALGFCAEGESEKFVADGGNTYGGRVVTNPSGGLLSKGHPLGATGLAQCFELVQQLRGTADARQVENARLALQHNLGLGGAAVVTLYGRG